FTPSKKKNNMLKLVSLALLQATLALTSCGTTGSTQKFKPIFDGKTLDGWEGDSTYWSVENGAIVGKITPATLLKRNTFIIWKGGQPADFELKAEFRISAEGNSGINYRSER